MHEGWRRFLKRPPSEAGAVDADESEQPGEVNQSSTSVDVSAFVENGGVPNCGNHAETPCKKSTLQEISWRANFCACVAEADCNARELAPSFMPTSTLSERE